MGLTDSYCCGSYLLSGTGCSEPIKTCELVIGISWGKTGGKGEIEGKTGEKTTLIKGVPLTTCPEPRETTGISSLGTGGG